MKTSLMVAPLLAALVLPAAHAQPVPRSAPAAVITPQSVPDAVDKPYPGVMTLDIDASDTVRGAFRVTQIIPVAAGPVAAGSNRLTVLYPQWLPGNHGPRGALAELVDLHFYAGGKELTWTRDPVEVFAFHVDLPAGTREVTAKFIRTTPLQTSEGRVVVTQEMLNLQWEQVSLYPAGHYVRQIRVKPTVTFPQKWQAATALDGQSAAGDRVTWAETDYETLIDSPIFAGINFRKWDLGNNVTLNVVADKPEQLDAKPEKIATLRALVTESISAFGAKHWDHYEFLVALTDRMGSIGLEHHRSSENQLEPDNFVKWDEFDWDRNVLAHELSHSWVGKFRRPAKLWTPDYRQPMQNNLLWVYEGQNQFWGLVLAARSGSQAKEIVLGQLASSAGNYAEQPGRGWRSVEDTTHDPVFAARRPKPFASLSRDEDYYNEGALIWLEADQIIRSGTLGRRGMDDFAKAFFGIRPDDWGQVTYEFGDIVSTLNAVYPYDWAGFLKTRIQTPGQPAPLNGITRAGYQLVWKEEPNPFTKARMLDAKSLSLNHSIGIVIDKDAKVTATRWNSAAFNAGIVNGVKILAVNGVTYDQDGIKKAITAAKGTDKPIDLLVQRGEKFFTLPIKYHDGLRYPWLERVGGAKAPATDLDRLLAPRAPSLSK
jgi:predicted metalloprotease with PDZ domain